MTTRIELIEKLDKNINYEPSKKELKEAYGYLSYCLICGEKLRLGESFSHGFGGNSHKFGCSIPARVLGVLYNIIKVPILLLILLILLPYYGIKCLVYHDNKLK